VFRSQHESEYYDHSNDSEDFEKSKNVSEKEVVDSYLESRIFAEENLRNDKWELQSLIADYYYYIQKFIENLRLLNKFVFS